METTPLLTIGMATFEDYPGVEATIMHIRDMPAATLDGVELLVVDNSPNTEQGSRTRELMEWSNRRPCPARYVAHASPVGTSSPRDRVFAEARGLGTVCVDSHVILLGDTVDRLKAMYAGGGGGVLHSGPMYNYALEVYATHFADMWRDSMWGIWESAWLCTCGGATFVVSAYQANAPLAPGVVVVQGGQPTLMCQYRRTRMGWQLVTSCHQCGKPFPVDLPYIQHEPRLVEMGYKRLGWDPANDPDFEIPGMGLGAFSCKTDEWLGFHPLALGFGGEELYIHEKFRRAGRPTICHPWFRWWHRFGRPCGNKDTPPYPITTWNKVRNYVLEFIEMGWALDPIYEHFVGGARMPEAHWKALVADPVNTVKFGTTVGPASAIPSSSMPQPADTATLDDMLKWVCETPRDAETHLPKVYELAKQCDHVTIMAKRREWDVPVLAARCPTVTSYLTEQDALTARLHRAVKACTDERRCRNYTTHNRDSSTVREIEPTEMLLIDTVHDADRLLMELGRCGQKVARWIVLRGTANFGEVREGGGGPGLLVGARKYMEENPEWHRVFQDDRQYGLTVLSRDPNERTIDRGPGTELHNILESIGISSTVSCSCRARSRQMDAWGPAGCAEHFAEIVQWMREGQDQFGWGDKMRAAAGMATKGLLSGLLFKVRWTDPFPGLVREAIKRAAKQDEDWFAAHPDQGQPVPVPPIPEDPEEEGAAPATLGAGVVEPPRANLGGVPGNNPET